MLQMKINLNDFLPESLELFISIALQYSNMLIPSDVEDKKKQMNVKAKIVFDEQKMNFYFSFK